MPAKKNDKPVKKRTKADKSATQGIAYKMPPDPSGKLSEKLILFCQLYTQNGYNATKAGISVGYSKKTAYSIASKVLKKVEVQEYIRVLNNDIGRRIGVTPDMIAKELAKIVFYDPRKAFKEDGSLKPINEFDDDTAGAIASIETIVVTSNYKTISASYGKTDEDEEMGDEEKPEIITTVKIKPWDKVPAATALNKMLGYDAPVKKEVTVNGGANAPVAIQVNVYNGGVPIQENET